MTKPVGTVFTTECGNAYRIERYAGEKVIVTRLNTRHANDTYCWHVASLPWNLGKAA